MAFTNFALYGGAFFTPVIVGKMTSTMNWRWPFYFVAIFSAIFLPAVSFINICPPRSHILTGVQVFFLVPETSYRRDVNTDLSSTEDLLSPNSGLALPTNEADSSTKEGASSGSEKTRAPYLKRLALFNGRKTDENLLKLMFRPFPLLFHPAIFWGMLTQGALIGWTVMVWLFPSF